MKKQQLQGGFILLWLCLWTGLNAQSSIVSSGSNITGTGGSVSYSVGQLVGAYYVNISNNSSLSLGVQIPFEIQVVSGIKDSRFNLTITAYPNPTTDNLTLTSDNFDFTHTVLQLYDMTGRLLWAKDMTTPEARISLNGFTPAAYLLKVVDNQKEIKTFKIIKK